MQRSKIYLGALIPSKSAPAGCDGGGGLDFLVNSWMGNMPWCGVCMWVQQLFSNFPLSESFSVVLLLSSSSPHVLSLSLRLPFIIYFVAPCESLTHLIQSTDLARSCFIPSPV